MVTPPLYAPDNRSKDAINYDGVMETYGAWLVAQRSAGWQVIDIHHLLHQSVAAAKKADPAFIYAKDNLHPGDQGHLFMAQRVWASLAPMMKWRSDVAFAEGEKLKLLRESSQILRDAWLKPDRPQASGGQGRAAGGRCGGPFGPAFAGLSQHKRAFTTLRGGFRGRAIT
jgi:hypothetical protein